MDARSPNPCRSGVSCAWSRLCLVPDGLSTGCSKPGVAPGAGPGMWVQCGQAALSSLSLVVLICKKGPHAIRPGQGQGDPGFLRADPLSSDIDECAQGAGILCTFRCINVPGSYQCACPERGYTMTANGRSCKGECGVRADRASGSPRAGAESPSQLAVCPEPRQPARERGTADAADGHVHRGPRLG